MTAGTYRIVNISNDKIYFGSAVNLHSRKLRHFRELRNGNHSNPHLQRAYDKYGKKSFEFEVLKTLSKDQLVMEEQKLLDEHSASSKCYNICSIVRSPFVRGRPKTEEHKKKLSAATKAYFATHPEAREKIRQLRLGKPLSEETKRNLRRSKKRGSEHHNAILTENDVRAIRNDYIPYKYGFGSLAKRHKVDRKTIVRIIQRKTWTHI